MRILPRHYAPIVLKITPTATCAPPSASIHFSTSAAQKQGVMGYVYYAVSSSPVFASADSFADSSIQLASTTSRTRLLYSLLSLSYSCDASALAGDAGFGSLSND